jgi:hypothetical protein
VVLDVAQLEALLTGTFSIGLDVGRGREKVALVRLRLSRALPGAAETQAMAAEALAIERGVATEQIAAAEGLALHAAAFNGMPDPVLHLAARAMGVVTGLALRLAEDPVSLFLRPHFPCLTVLAGNPFIHRLRRRLRAAHGERPRPRVDDRHAARGGSFP